MKSSIQINEKDLDKITKILEHVESVQYEAQKMLDEVYYSNFYEEGELTLEKIQPLYNSFRAATGCLCRSDD